MTASDPQVQEILDMVNAFAPALTVQERRLAFARLSFFSGHPDSQVRTTDLEFKSRDGKALRLRSYRGPRVSEKPSAALLYFHGGGYVAGDLDTHHSALTHLSAMCDALIFHLDYRRAPEFLYPTALYDAQDGLQYLVTTSQVLGVDPERISVGGDSAGGNLAAALSLTRRNQIKNQILLYPTLDARFQGSSWSELPPGLIASRKDSGEFNLLYARTESDFDDPIFSPVLNQDLRDLPSAHFFVGSLDPAQSDSLTYAGHLRQQQVSAKVELIPQLIHGFVTMSANLKQVPFVFEQIAEILATRNSESRSDL